MVTGDWLYNINLGVILLGTLLIFLLSLGLGFWLGNRHRKEIEQDPHINTIQAATLGLLGLLMAFTFSMAADRYASRRRVVVDEANAIGTTYLRADMLPEPHRAQVKDLLRAYVDTRIEFMNAGIDPLKFQQATDKTMQLQDQLWQQAIAVSAIDSRSVPTGLFVQSLNEMIDLQATRQALIKNRVPEVIIDLIFISAVITIGLIGYAIGMARKRNLIPTLMMIILITIIFAVIIDLDRPRRGLIRVSQESMIQLQENIR